MAYRNGTYAAFYVSEPFTGSNLGPHLARDFRYYNLLRVWKAEDSTFPFVDSHDKTYNVRDGSNWETTLKPRIRERLRNSKNIVLFLSSITEDSRALCEEMDYGINTLGLPVIVVYPDFKEESDIIVCETKTIRKQVRDLWNRLPTFRDGRAEIPTIHVPIKQERIRAALQDPDFSVHTKGESKTFFFPC